MQIWMSHIEGQWPQNLQAMCPVQFRWRGRSHVPNAPAFVGGHCAELLRGTENSGSQSKCAPQMCEVRHIHTAGRSSANIHIHMDQRLGTYIWRFMSVLFEGHDIRFHCPVPLQPLHAQPHSLCIVYPVHTRVKGCHVRQHWAVGAGPHGNPPAHVESAPPPSGGPCTRTKTRASTTTVW